VKFNFTSRQKSAQVFNRRRQKVRGTQQSRAQRTGQATVPQPAVASPEKNKDKNFIKDYFARHPEFPYDERGETWEQFYTLKNSMDWDQPDLQSEREYLRDAIVQEFNLIYGTDENDILAWQSLCRVVRMQPVPSTIGECRQVREPRI
jgi:hypothetical protein